MTTSLQLGPRSVPSRCFKREGIFTNNRLYAFPSHGTLGRLCRGTRGVVALRPAAGRAVARAGGPSAREAMARTEPGGAGRGGCAGDRTGVSERRATARPGLVGARDRGDQSVVHLCAGAPAAGAAPPTPFVGVGRPRALVGARGGRDHSERGRGGRVHARAVRRRTRLARL